MAFTGQVIRARVLPALIPADGRDIELRSNDELNLIQWRYVGETTWRTLVAYSEITGPVGPGTEFRINDGVIQYRPVGSGEEGWQDLVPLTDITGPQGEQGPAGEDGTDGADGAPGAGLAAGGSTSQILKKASGTDYDTEWGFVDRPTIDAPLASAVAYSAKEFGATGDGSTDDDTPLDNFIAYLTTNGEKGILPPGEFLTTQVNVTPTAPFSLYGAGPHISKFLRDSDGGTFMFVKDSQGALYSDFAIDNRYPDVAAGGHGLVLQNSNNQRVRSVDILNFGNADDVTAGTGLIALPTLTTDYVTNVVFEDIHVKSYDGAQNTVGTLIVDGRYCRQSGIFAENCTHFGVEFKEDTRYSTISNIIVKNSEIAVGYGQSTEGVDGCDYNAAVNIVAHECTQAITVGEGTGNVFSNIVAVAFDATDTYGVDHSTDSVGTLVTGLATFGTSFKYPVRCRAARSYTSIASHDSATNIVTLDSGATKNIVEVLHPGARTAVEGAISDASGNGINGTAANVVFCNATGEYIGTLSGYWKWKLGTSGSSFSNAQRWRYESDSNVVLGLASPGGSSDTAGVQVNKGSTANHAAMVYVFGSDYWSIRANATNVGRFAANLWRPENDNLTTLGNASARFSTVYAGTGTINTSDKRLKQDIVDAAEDEAAIRAVRKIKIKRYRWKDAVQAKGDTARLHFGAIAQEVKAAFESEGLDPFAYGILCYDEWDAEDEIVQTWDAQEEIIEDISAIPELRDPASGLLLKKGRKAERRVVQEAREAGSEVVREARAAGNRYGVRYDELLALKIAALEADI